MHNIRISIERQLLSLLMLLFLAGFQSTGLLVEGQSLQRYQIESVQMGGVWSITLYATDEQKAKHAAKLAFNRVAEINQIFSDYSDKSELNTILNSYQPNVPTTVSEEFFQLVQTAQHYAEWSEGAFDITVGPLTQLWRRAYRKKQFPAEEIWQQAKSTVGYQQLKSDNCHKSLTFQLPWMKLDFGAIAKGYAADQALQVLKQLGHNRSLVDGNGNFAAGDPPPGKNYWTIEVLQLDAMATTRKVYIKIANQGVSTSGDFSQSITINEKRYSHIIDPRTAKPQEEQRLVTVIAPDGMTADILSTVLCLNGESFLKPTLDKHPEAHVSGSLLESNRLRTFSSPRWNQQVLEISK